MQKNTNNFFPVSKTSNIIVQEFSNEMMVYNLTNNRAYLLNHTCSLVFRHADGTNAISDISRQMSKTTGSAVSEDFVWLTLNELKANDLLESSDEISTRFAGLTRREVVKRIGASSMVALPVITSIAAPSSANAQSNSGIACTTTLTGSQGTCPVSTQRCVNSTCVDCIPNGIAPPGGCTLADLSGARQCCSGTCSLSTNFCTSL